MAVNLEAIASYSSMRLVDSLAEGLAVCLFAALILRLSRRQNAGTRFAIGFAALLAITVLPLARGLWPHSQLASSAPAVVVPGSRAVQKGQAAEWGISLYTPVIVKYRDEKTDKGVELEEWLR